MSCGTTGDHANPLKRDVLPGARFRNEAPLDFEKRCKKMGGKNEDPFSIFFTLHLFASSPSRCTTAAPIPWHDLTKCLPIIVTKSLFIISL